jgi:putative hydrolase of HD superfamily
MGNDVVSLSSKNILIRDWRLHDLEPYAHWLQPGHKWQDFDGPYYARLEAAKIPDLIARLRERIIVKLWDDVRRDLVIARKTDEVLIGRVSWYWQSKETNWLSIGIAVYDPAIWGQGIGYEALGLWCEYLWTAVPTIVRLDLRTWSGNIGMMRLAEKLGFREEARFRQARIVNGEYYDGMGYGILREEWQAYYPDGFGK